METGLAKYMTREQIRAAGGYNGNDNPIVDPSKGLKSLEQGDSTIENARTFSRSPSEGTGHDAGVVDQQMQGHLGAHVAAGGQALRADDGKRDEMLLTRSRRDGEHIPRGDLEEFKTALSSKEGEFVTTTTTSAPTRASARPAPVNEFTPVEGEAGAASWRRARRLGMSCFPMRPVPPMTIVAEGVRLAPRARLAYVTPAHQFPLCVAMHFERRMELLEWSRRTGLDLRRRLR